MILLDLVLPSRINQCWQYSGIDSPGHCLDREHFKNYPHKIEYVYNSRGFRDSEWPESLQELQSAIWCMGDSFTVGFGSPYNFIWPQVLSRATGRRCINVSMDGASNDWISRRGQQIIKEIQPSWMVVLWSYVHRRESDKIELRDEERRIYSNKSDTELDNITNFVNCYSSLKNCSPNVDIFNGAIPQFGLTTPNESIDHIHKNWNNIKDPSWPREPPIDRHDFDLLPDHIKNDVYIHAPDLLKHFEENNPYLSFRKKNQLLELDNLDWARDHHHFDSITSEFFVGQILKNFNL